jgi:SagB-type dehydrogenase family enzyme
VLDWETKPLPFKVYPALEQIRLPTDLPALAVDTFVALDPADPSARPAALDLERLAALLFFSAGVTRVKTYPGGAQIHFRAAASTGALYQTEVYVVAGAVEGLAPGVYHFSAGDFSLRRLRAGDFRGTVALATADDVVAAQPASLILSAIYWRNTWKYQARGYRHLFWDAGTLLGQLLAVARALDVPARLIAGFVTRSSTACSASMSRRKAPSWRSRWAPRLPPRPRPRSSPHSRPKPSPCLLEKSTTRSCATPTTTRPSTPKPRSPTGASRPGDRA